MSNIYQESITQSLSPGTSCKRKSCTPSDEVILKRIKEASDNSELPDASITHLTEDHFYKKGGLAHTLHGNIYQLKLLMLFLKRALREGYEFNLGTEVEDAEKFDDIVLRYKPKSGNSKLCAIQVKHRQNESEKITENDLLKPFDSCENDFSLQKYFISFRKIKKNPNFQEHELKDFVLYTNIDFGDLGTIQLNDYQECDDILHVTTSSKSAKRYKLKVSKDHDIYDALKRTSDFHVLLNALKQHIIKNKKIERRDIFKLYHHVLSDELFESGIKEEQNASGKKCIKRFIKFRSDFLNGNNLSEEIRNFRNALKSEGSNFWKTLSQIELIISEDFGKVSDSQNSSIGFPNDEVEDIEIEEFFEKHLVFAVNQPNVDELGKVITDEMGESSQFNLLNADLVSDSFQRKVLDWLKEKRKEKGREGVWLNAHSGQKFLDSIEKEISCLISIGISIAYPEELSKYGIMTKSLSVLEDINNFLTETSKNILHIVAEGETLLSSINVYNALEVLKKQNNFMHLKKSDSHIFVNLKTLLLEKNRMYLMSAFESTHNYNLLIIDCETAGETREWVKLYLKLTDILVTTDKKIIFISDKKNNFVDLFEENKKLIIINDIKFSDLTESSKENLLQKKVEFQGQRISFNKLIDQSDENANEIINKQVILKLLKGDDIKINCSMQDLGNVNDYYINRKFERVVLSKENINTYLSDNGARSDLFVISGTYAKMRHQNVFEFSEKRSAECKFLELCVQNTDSNIHWLKCRCKSLIWYKSYGSVSNIIQCRSSESIRSAKELHPIEENEFVQDEEFQRLVIISDIAGMGKSTVLTHLSMELKKYFKGSWIIRIDLNDHTIKLKLNKQKDLFGINKMELLDFLFLDLQVLKFDSILEEKLFRNMFVNNRNFVVLIDGFDEIYPDYKEIVIELLQALKENNAKKVFVTTRPNVKVELEKVLGTFSHELLPLTKEEQHQFLTSFWKTKLKVINFNQQLEYKLKIYVDAVINLVFASTNSNEREFIGIPLQTMLLAEIFQNNNEKSPSKWQGCQEFLISDRDKPKLPTSFALLELYEYFIGRKFHNFYLEGKRRRDLSKVGEEEDATKKFKTFEQKCFILALSALFSEEMLNYLLSPYKMQELKTLIDEFKKNEHNEGIIDRLIGDTPQFIHRTFAEYFASFPIAEKMLVDAAATLCCIDSALLNFSPIFINKLIDHLDGKQVMINSSLKMPLMCFIVKENCFNFAKCLYESNLDAWPKKLDINGKTPLHYAVDLGLLDVAERLIECANDIYQNNMLQIDGSFRNPDYVNSRIVKVVNITDNDGKSALNYALQNNYVDFAFKLLLKGASIDILTDDELNASVEKLILYKSNSYVRILPSNVIKYQPILEKLFLKSPSFFNKICTNDQSAVLSHFFVHGRVTVIHTLLSMITDFEQRKNILNEIHHHFTPLDKVNRSCYLSDTERLAITKYLLHHGAIKTNIGNPKMKCITHILYAAIRYDSLNTFKYFISNENHENYLKLLDQACLYTKFQFIKYLVENHYHHLTDKNGNTALHCASANSANLKIIQFLLDYYDINAINERGETCLFMAIIGCKKLKVIDYLINKGSDINKEDVFGNTPLSCAIERRNSKHRWSSAEDRHEEDIVEYLLSKGARISDRASQLTRDKLSCFNDQCCIDMVHVNTYFRLHIAIESGNFEWAKFLIENGADVNKLDFEGKTPLHWACMINNADFARSLLEYGAIFDIKDKNHKIPYDLVSSSKIEYFWFLNRLNAVLSSQNFMETLEGKIELSAFSNARNSRGQTLLHFAAEHVDPKGIYTLEQKKQTLDSIIGHLNQQSITINTTDSHNNTPIHLAAQRGNDVFVSLLLEKGAVFNKINSQGETPKKLALRYNHQKIVKLIEPIEKVFAEVAKNSTFDVLNFIEEYPSYLGVINESGKTLLHLTASFGELLVVQDLLRPQHSLCVDIEAIDFNNNTPLHCAALNNRFDIVKLLFEYGANYDARNIQNQKPLDLVPKHSHKLVALFEMVNTLFGSILSENVEKFINDFKMLAKNIQIDIKTIVNVRDGNKNTLLHYACNYVCEYKIVEMLLENGAWYDVQNNLFIRPNYVFSDKTITTVLMAVNDMFKTIDNVYRNQEVNLKIIINVRNRFGKGLLIQAIFSYSYEIVKYLVRKGAIVDWNAIEYAFSHFNITLPKSLAVILEIMKYLFDCFGVDNTNYKGETLLLVAVKTTASRGRLDLIKYLVDKGSDVNHEDICGNTPFSQAIKCDHKDVIEYLLTKKAQVSERAPQCIKDKIAVLLNYEN